MSGSCLLVTSAAPSPSGAPDWRRFAMLAAFYRNMGLDVYGLVLTEAGAPPGAAAVDALAAVVASPAFAAVVQAPEAVAALDARADFDLIHSTSVRAAAHLGAWRRAVRLLDLPGRLADARALEHWAPHTDLFVAQTAAELGVCRAAGLNAVNAPYLRAGRRLARRRIAGARLLAGCWVEAEARSIRSVTAFFDAVRARGGGFAPGFALAGPGAAAVEPPRLPFPVTRMPTDMTERVFYRGLDLLICPDIGAGAGLTEAPMAPRYDVTAALEFGATPLAARDALIGFSDVWRLPQFDDLAALAEYLFENGRALAEGGLMAELRARADWTWSGLSGAAARWRGDLAAAIRERMKEEALA